jgi:hypothetical protein
MIGSRRRARLQPAKPTVTYLPFTDPGLTGVDHLGDWVAGQVSATIATGADMLDALEEPIPNAERFPIRTRFAPEDAPSSD